MFIENTTKEEQHEVITDESKSGLRSFNVIFPEKVFIEIENVKKESKLTWKQFLIKRILNK